MALKQYPVGIQTFERIRKEDKLYIDKTEYIYRMTHSGGCYFFLGRPRRFGKSLLVSTFDSYFSGKKELFKGLAIEQLEHDWTPYPVLHFDLSGGKHMEREQLEEYLDYILGEQEKKWQVANPPKGANNRLTELVNTAYAKSGRQVVVLIDEYDAPMLDVAHERESLDVLRNIMRNFYSPLKMCEPKLRFVFPKKEFGAYWFSWGTPTYLIKMLRKFAVLPTKIGKMYARSSAFDAPTENMKTITPLLYQSGYVTIKDYDRISQLYLLDLPNKEIKVGLFESLLPNYLDGMYAEEGDVTIARMSVLIRQGDMDGALRLLQEFLGTVPYCNNTNYEGHYQQVLFIIFTLLTHFVVDVEVHTPNGRVDVVMLTDDTLYIIELKLNKDAQTAMQQINLKQYDKRFALCGKPVVKVGVNFDSEKGNIDDWTIE